MLQSDLTHRKKDVVLSLSFSYLSHIHHMKYPGYAGIRQHAHRRPKDAVKNRDGYF